MFIFNTYAGIDYYESMDELYYRDQDRHISDKGEKKMNTVMAVKTHYIAATSNNTLFICDNNVLGNKNITYFDSIADCRRAIKKIKKTNQIAKYINFIVMEAKI